MSDIYTYIIGPGLAGLIGWLVGKRKNTADAQAVELENVEKGLEIYRKMKEDFITFQAEMRQEIEKVYAENKNLKEEYAKLIAENRTLKYENINLRKRLTALEKEIEEIIQRKS